MFSVFPGIAGDFPDTVFQLVGQPQVTFGAEGDGGTLPRDNVQPVLFQLEVADHRRVKQADHIRELGIAKPGRKFGGQRGTPDDITPFQHQHRFTGIRKIACCGQSVVASTNNNRIVLHHVPPDPVI